jgi:hypothetical protein
MNSREPQIVISGVSKVFASGGRELVALQGITLDMALPRPPAAASSPAANW